MRSEKLAAEAENSGCGSSDQSVYQDLRKEIDQRESSSTDFQLLVPMWHTDDVEDDRSHIQGGGSDATLLLKDLFSTQFVKTSREEKNALESSRLLVAEWLSKTSVK